MKEIIEKLRSLKKDLEDESMWGSAIEVETVILLLQNENSKLAEREKQELYCVVLWLNGNPILDGMPYFQTKDRAIEYAREQEKYAEQHPEFNATYTIISIKLESERDKTNVVEAKCENCKYWFIDPIKEEIIKESGEDAELKETCNRENCFVGDMPTYSDFCCNKFSERDKK